MNDHTNNPMPEDALLTAYALGELDPQSEAYQSIAAKVADDPALQAQTDQIASLASQLTQSYAKADGPGLEDATLTNLINSSHAPIARIHRKPSLTRRLLPYAGVAACATLATSAIFLAMRPEPTAPIVIDNEPDETQEPITPTLVVEEVPNPLEETREKLAEPISLQQDNMSLDQLIAFVREETGINVIVNWPALELVGIDQDSLVILNVSELPAKTVLDLVLEQVSADCFDDDKLGYRIAEGYIKISTLRDLKSETETRIYDFNQLLAQGNMFTRFKGDLFAQLVSPDDRNDEFRDDFDGLFGTIDTQTLGSSLFADDFTNDSSHAQLGRTTVYDIRDLTVQVPNFKNPPNFDLNSALSGTNSGGQGSLFGDSGGGEGGLFGDDSDSEEEENRPKLTAEQYQDLASRQELVDQYIEMIQTTVGDPDEWLDEESTVTELGGKFVIKTTPENHEAIDRLLGLMKDRPDPMNDEQLNAMAKEIIDDVEMGLIELEQRQAIREIERERRERFAELTDNPFKLAEHEPLSTFSVDVDTASYAYGRRAILANKTLPSPDAVRIEEWINYFDYGYTAPVVDPDALPNGRLTTAALEKLEAADDTFVPFTTHVEVAQCPWTEGNQLVRIGIKAMEVAQSDRPPAHLVFLLDVSGSMSSPDKLGLVQQGMPMLLEQLNDTDKVSIVVYAGASGLVLEAAEAADKNKIKEAITSLKAGGSTAGGAGIKLAYDIASKHFVAGGVNRVILCTDGDFNVGTSDTDELVQLVKAKANPQGEDKSKGVYLSVMGFGTGNLNDEMMEKITNAGNGNYHYIDSVNEAVKTMSSQAGGTLVTVAKDVKLQLEFNPAKVASYRLIGYENRILRNEDFNNDTVDAGDIGAGHSVTALYEIVPVKDDADAAPKDDPVIDDLRYQKPRGLAAAAELPELLTLKLRYKPVDAAAEQGTSRKVVKHVPAQAIEFAKASEATRFTSSVAALGMILRGSPHKGNATTQWVVDTAQEAKAHDPSGYRNEFVQLATQVGLIHVERDEAFRKDLLD